MHFGALVTTIRDECLEGILDFVQILNDPLKIGLNVLNQLKNICDDVFDGLHLFVKQTFLEFRVIILQSNEILVILLYQLSMRGQLRHNCILFNLVAFHHVQLHPNHVLANNWIITGQKLSFKLLVALVHPIDSLNHLVQFLLHHELIEIRSVLKKISLNS